MTRLRPADRADVPAITAIYNEGIAGREATFETRPREPDEVAAWLGEGRPLLVAEQADGAIVGFARVDAYSSRSVYRGVGEHGVYVASAARGRGVGLALLCALCEAAERAGYYKLTAKIFTSNGASRSVHRAAGFDEVGIQRRHGRLDGEWRDCVLVERLLGEAARDGRMLAGMGAGEPIDLARIVNLLDFEPLARLAMDSGASEYVAGGSWDEVTLDENMAAWRRRKLRPRVLIDVSRVSTQTTMLGEQCGMPVAIAPMAEAGTAHPDGDVAAARAAVAAGIPFILSTFSTRSIEEVAAATPEATRWFQLYVEDDRGRSRSRVERAAAGYRAIVLTVDLPVSGYRERELRSGFHGPAPVGGRRVVAADTESGDEPITELLTRSLTWADLAVIRSWAPGLPLVVKGILSGDDARLAVENGADAIVVSNHGARQLDRVAATVDVLEEVVEAVAGRTEVWVDGGVRRGLDIAIALALGARGVLLGRPAFWALAAGGQAGVERALAIVREELETVLALLGTPAVSDITRAHIGR